jgi:hypothetical protein
MPFIKRSNDIESEREGGEGRSTRGRRRVTLPVIICLPTVAPAAAAPTSSFWEALLFWAISAAV